MKDIYRWKDYIEIPLDSRLPRCDVVLKPRRSVLGSPIKRLRKFLSITDGR